PLDRSIRRNRRHNGASVPVLPERERMRIPGIRAAGRLTGFVTKPDKQVMKAGILDFACLDAAPGTVAVLSPGRYMCAGVEQANANAPPVGMKAPQKIVGPVGTALSGAPEREAVADGHGCKPIGVANMDVGAAIDLPAKTFRAAEALHPGCN